MARKKKRPLIAIIGRPNVGKSSLFNRILGQKLSIVGNLSGITRDRIYTNIDHFAKPFGIIDTGGLSFNEEDDFQNNIEEQVNAALEECHSVLFVVDGLEGQHTLDREVANIIRQAGKPCYLAINKLEKEKQHSILGDFASLGFDQMFPLSAQQNLGIKDCLKHILEEMPHLSLSSEENPIKVAVMGRPNVGKSSFINKMSNENRLIVSKISGTTRDAIDIAIKREGQHYLFIDTAGLRSKSNIKDSIEFYSTTRTSKSLKRADVVLLLISAEDGLTTQDLKILRMIKKEGKAAAIIINKWDLFSEIHPRQYILDHMTRIKPYRYMPYLFISAQEGNNVIKTLNLINLINEEQTLRISTGILNRFLQKIVKQTPPPREKGRLLKFYYMSQVDRTPPTFQISINDKKLIDPSYERYIENKIRTQFGFTGAPIRIKLNDKEK